MPQKHCKTVEYDFNTEHYTFGNMNLNTSVKSSTVLLVLKGTVWGKVSVVTMGSFDIFTGMVTKIWFLHGQFDLSGSMTSLLFFINDAVLGLCFVLCSRQICGVPMLPDYMT